MIESADPSTSEPITVTVDGANSTWDPATAVVYAGRADSQCAGPSASVCCGYMNFFATRAAARAWAASHLEITGGVLGQGRAVQVGISIFGQLLSQPHPLGIFTRDLSTLNRPGEPGDCLRRLA
jgi:Alkylmercury lyase